MSNKKSNDNRRRLLKSIAAGSGAVVAGKSLPESWSKPAINSILLPAHAQLTDDTGSLPGEETTPAPAPCSECAIISGRSIACGSRAPADVFYEIEVVDGCISLNEVSSKPEHPLYLRIEQKSDFFVQITLELYVNGVDVEVDDFSLFCNSDNPADDVRDSDLPGGGVLVTFTWTSSATNRSVTVSDIIVCPDAR